MADGVEDAEDRTDGGPCGDIAAYVLGVLDPAQRTAFARHLAGCGDCRRDETDFGAFTPVLRTALGPRVPSRSHRLARDVLLVAAGVVVAVAAVLSVAEAPLGLFRHV